MRQADGDRGPTFNSPSHAGGKDLVTVVVELYRDNPTLFKTPTANLGSNGAPQHPDKRKAGGHGATLEDEVCFLLNVEPDAEPGDGPHSPREWWGKFADAIERWESICRKAAPVPIEYGPRGGIRLSPRFCEWLMGLPEGWVTEVEGVDRNEQISRIGNGVMPLQAFAAFKHLTEVADGTDASDSGPSGRVSGL